MGKSRNKKIRAKKGQPTGLPSMKEALAENADELEGVTSTSNGYLQLASHLEKLQSGSFSERETACACLASYALNEESILALLDQNAVKCLGPLLLDDSVVVREEAAGALRNLSLANDTGVCERMVKDDIMTPLSLLIKKTFDSLESCSQPSQKEERDPQFNIMEQALLLLCNLCENCSAAVEILNRDHLPQLMLHCLDPQQLPIALCLAAGQCLQTVTEDNRVAGEALVAPEHLGLIEGALSRQAHSSKEILLRTLLTGTLCNVVKFIEAPSHFCKVVNAVVAVLSQTLDPDPVREVAAALDGGVKGPSDEKGGAGELQGQLLALLGGQQTVLEIASNICYLDDENDAWEDWEEDSSRDSGELQSEEAMEEDSSPTLPFSLSEETLSAFTSHNLHQKVLDKVRLDIQSLPKNLEQQPPNGVKILKKLWTIRSRALICLQNMVSVMGLDSLGGHQALSLLWDILLHMLLHQPASCGEEYEEALSGATRAVAQKMAAEQCPPQNLTADQLSRLSRACQAAGCHSVRANMAAMLGSIGSLLARQQPEAEDLLTTLGNLLLDVACKDGTLWVVSQALDALFDVFGDGELANKVSTEINLISRLKVLQPTLKSRMRLNKQLLGDRLPIVQEVRTNLARFIRYKEGNN